jgi:hypothetical protein
VKRRHNGSANALRRRRGARSANVYVAMCLWGSEGGSRGSTMLTPDDARELSQALLAAADATEAGGGCAMAERLACEAATSFGQSR